MEFRCTVSALVSSSKNYRRVIGDKNLWILKANLQPKPQSRSEVDFCRHSPLTGGGALSVNTRVTYYIKTICAVLKKAKAHHVRGHGLHNVLSIQVL